jgi:hypothetical protein
VRPAHLLTPDDALEGLVTDRLAAQLTQCLCCCQPEVPVLQVKVTMEGLQAGSSDGVLT